MKEKFNYLKGLFDGIGVSTKTKEGMILNKIVSFMEEISDKIDELEKQNSELRSLVRSLEQELHEIAHMIYGDEEEVEEIICSGCGKVLFVGYDIEKVVCPKCETIVYHNIHH